MVSVRLSATAPVKKVAIYEEDREVSVRETFGSRREVPIDWDWSPGQESENGDSPPRSKGSMPVSLCVLGVFAVD